MIQDLIPNSSNHLKRLSRSNGINNNVPMNSNKMLRIQNTIFILCTRSNNSMCQRRAVRGPLGVVAPAGNGERTYLSGGIDDLSRIVLTVVFDDSTECVFNCGVVTFDEVVFDESDC